MLTPQEVSERAFQKASFGGYNMTQVDEFLDILTADYSVLYSENAVLKSKMKVLVDKVEEYRATEEAMRKALMTAQRMADELVREAEEKRNEILRQAEGEARTRIADLAKETEVEAFRLQQAKQSTAAFVERVRALHAAQETFLAGVADTLPTPTQQATNEVEDAADEIDDNVQRMLAQAMLDATAENLKARQEEPVEADMSDTAEFGPICDVPPQPEVHKDAKPQQDEDEATPHHSSRIDFGSLQFGRDYEIK